MAFRNLVRPPHLTRLLLALTAGTAAVVIYLTAEHFQVVPATAALDDEMSGPRALSDRAIAVIPAVGEETGAFSHGVALELIRLLVRVPELEVIAPRSAFAYAAARRAPGKPSLSLDAAWFLEVRSTPEDVDMRLRASLRPVGRNEPAWVLEERRPVAEVSGFIDAVLARLAGQFDVKVPDEPSALHGGLPSTWRDYFTAWALQGGGAEGLEEAGRLLEGILQAKPDWAPALAADAHNLLLQAAAGGPDSGQLVESAKSRLEEAQAVQPGLAETYLYRSLIAHRFEWDWQQAYASARDALERAPGDADVLATASTAAFTLGRFEEGAEQLRQAIALDPLVLGHRLKYGLMLEFAGLHQAAIDAYRELMVIDPDYPGVHAYLGRTLVILDRTEAGYRHAQLEKSPFWRRYATLLALYALGRREEADAALEAMIADHGFEAAVQIAEIHAFAGRPDEAFEWLALAVEQRDQGLASLVGNPLFEELDDDPRWPELLETLNLVNE